MTRSTDTWQGRGIAIALSLATWSLVAAPTHAAAWTSHVSRAATEGADRPGPSVLYAAPAHAPQLQNTGVWRAQPILVSGASAYRGGEFLYQDWLYDDRGAAGVVDPSTPGLSDRLGSPSTGTLTYPTSRDYANNAADLVELRVKPLRRATAFRVTLNTMKDPDLTAFTVAVGSSTSSRSWPYSAGVRSPARIFLTVHGEHGILTDAATGRQIRPAPLVKIDTRRRQVDVRVFHAAWNPRRSAVRLAAGIGLWDRTAGHYATPGAGASATLPGGSSPSRAALFNVAFRPREPIPDPAIKGLALTLADYAVAAKADGTWWREKQQAESLAAGDVSPFFARVDFDALRRGVTNNGGVPKVGPINRIFASHNAFGQGVDYGRTCGRVFTPADQVDCEGIFQGPLQTYTLYVPHQREPGPRGLTVLLHSLTSNYNEYTGSRFQSQLGERGDGHYVLTPGGRGPDGDYTGAPEADVFEAWADVARRYNLDPQKTALTGFSMGGGGTWKLSSRWPDLFSRVVGVGAVPLDDGRQFQWQQSWLNIPLRSVIGSLDEGALSTSEGDPTVHQKAIDSLAAHGLRFRYDTFAAADHLTVVTNDQWAGVAQFFGEHRVARNPARVSYVRDSRADYPGVKPDHAYWLSHVLLRSPRSKPVGSVDVMSGGFGLAAPALTGVRSSFDVLTGGYHGPMPYQIQEQGWISRGRTSPRDVLWITGTNIAELTIDVARARVTCGVDLRIISDGPLAVHLQGCPP